MKRIHIIVLIMVATVATAAEWTGGILTDYVCQEDVYVIHKDSLRDCIPDMHNDGFYLNTPGRGIINELDLEQTEFGSLILSGQIISNNTGFQIQGVPLYTGDLSTTNVLNLMAISNADGEFKVRLDSHMKTKIDNREKYFYIGKSFSRLLQYEIPYSWVQQDKSNVCDKPEN